jgi:SAM-dependent methyltransferase
MEDLRKVSSKFKLNEMWRRLVLRGVRYSDNYKKLDVSYLVMDPWGMASPREQYRFVETNRIILKKLGRVESLLEIGCGEGHQSVELRQVCDQLFGLDVSRRAVSRARRRCPQGEFLVGDVFSHEVAARGPFDLVVACEVLYYVADVAAVLRRMRTLGRKNLVTYFEGEMETLDPLVLSFPGVVAESFEFKDARWRCAWWGGDRV